MKLKLFAVLFLFGLVLVASVWTYKGNELKDNQILVFVTGSDPSPTEAQSGVPTIDPRMPTQVRVDGTSIACKVTHFETDSKAIGRYAGGSLRNGVQVPADNLYLKVQATHDWATTETINSLEIAGCAVGYTTGGKLRINGLSAQTGGSIYPPSLTHQNGLDADMAFTCKKPGGGYVNCNNQDHSVGTFDPEMNWLFVRSLAEYTPVRRILLDKALINQLKVYARENDPGPLTDQIFSTPLLLHWKGHANHFHVTFHCSPSDKPGCVEDSGGFRGQGASGPLIEEVETGEEEAGTAGVAAKSDTELLALARTRSPRCLFFNDEELNPVISECSAEYGINEKLIKAQMIAESGGSCGDNGGDPLARSGAAASGLLQLREIAVRDVNTYREAEDRIEFDDLVNPSINVCAGTQYMAILWQRRVASNIRTTEDLLAAYNWGPGAFRDSGGLNLPAETTDYVARIKRKYREKFGSELPTDPSMPGVAMNAKGNSAAPRVV